MANVESLTEHLAATKVLPLYTAIDMSLLDPLEELLIKHDIRLIED
jgi:2-dehydro-3-deoxyphosphogluconate aldolase/(4S)-4-hydroxy-2-oxoglutarate aldolase